MGMWRPPTPATARVMVRWVAAGGKHTAIVLTATIIINRSQHATKYKIGANGTQFFMWTPSL